MEFIRLPKGTIEHLIVDVKDRLGNVATLDGAGSRFDTRLKDVDDDTYVDEGIAASNVGMSVYPLIDTTQVGYVRAVYELFVQFDNLPESPRLGPFEFEVI